VSITPKQAFEAAKVLWPDTRSLTRYGKNECIFHGSMTVDIDWGDTDQYPLPEPEWVDAVFPDDVGKEGRFSNDGKRWVPGLVCGRWPSGLWIGYSTQWVKCQVRKERHEPKRKT